MTADGESEAGGSEAESEVSVSSKRSEQRKFSLFRRVGKFGKAARAAIVEEAKNAVNDVKEFAVGVRDGAQLTVQDAADYREKLATQAGEGWFLRGVVAEEAVASDVDSTVVPGTAPQSQQIEEQPLSSALEQVEQGDKESAAQPNDDEPLVVKVSKVADGEASPGKGFGLSHLWQRTSRSARPSCASEPPVPEVSVSAVSAVAAFASVAANAASAAAAAASASADALRGDAGAASSSSSWMMNPSTVANYVVLFDVETPRRGRAARSAVSWKARRLGGRLVRETQALGMLSSGFSDMWSHGSLSSREAKKKVEKEDVDDPIFDIGSDESPHDSTQPVSWHEAETGDTGFALRPSSDIDDDELDAADALVKRAYGRLSSDEEDASFDP